MTTSLVFLATLLAADRAGPSAGSSGTQPASAEAGEPGETGETSDAEEPQGGAGVSPIEIVPRLELRHSFQRLDNGAGLHETTTEMDIQFLRRLLLRLQIPYRTLGTPAGQISGAGDMQLGMIAIMRSTPTYLLGLLAGMVLDTATQPQLGLGKQQLYFGGGVALKPVIWILLYGVVQEQLSVGGDPARPDINELSGDLGAIVFGRQYNWLKLDLLPTVDFPGGATGRFYGVLEAGSLLVGRVGLFVRVGTQFVGERQLDYSVAGGVRYLFRLAKGKSL